MLMGLVGATENAMTCHDHVVPSLDPTGGLNRVLLTANLAEWRMPQSLAPCVLAVEGNISGFHRFRS